MTIQECYKEMGADYEEVFHRLPRESMVLKFALMFLNDDSYPKLEQSLKEGNAQEAFRAAHTLKGVCQNLGFTNLYQPAYELTEVLRAGTLGRLRGMVCPCNGTVQDHDGCHPWSAVTQAAPTVFRPPCAPMQRNRTCVLFMYKYVKIH